MRGLGELERAIMDTVWNSANGVSGRDVVKILNQDRELAYTTVLTVMDRLVTKGFLTRTRSGRHYVYAAVQSRAAYTAGLMAEVLGDAEDQRDVLLHFVGQVPSAITRQLREFLNEKASPAEEER
jgi:predicted transcriptional regulator